MMIAGLQRLTLIDYPGKLACIVFTSGCPLRCPYCHNPHLVGAIKSDKQILAEGGMTESDFFDFLDKRVGKIDGVVITGGEPSIHPGLIDFIKKVRAKGFLIKLDSDGVNPAILEKVIDQKLVDYIAMDIKHSKNKYYIAAGVKYPIKKITESVDIIMNSGVDYEFRTTVVPTIHEYKDFEDISEWIAGAKNYYLQQYREDTTLDPTLPSRTKGQTMDLDKIKDIMSKELDNIKIRKAYS